MLRWGICGGGKISHDFVVGIKTRSESEHSVVAVSTRSVDSSARFAATHNIPRYYGSYDELANDEEVRSGSSFVFPSRVYGMLTDVFNPAICRLCA